LAVTAQNVYEALVRASALLTRETDSRSLISVLVEQAIDISHSELACLYLYPPDQDTPNHLTLAYRRGPFEVPNRLSRTSEIVEFCEDANEAVVVLDRNQTFFNDIFLYDGMGSAIALPLSTPNARIGILILNARAPRYYNRERLQFLDSLSKLAAGMLNNSRLYEDLKEQYRRIEGLERYQENVFSSMTNLLVTVNSEGSIEYFNEAAAERLGLCEESVGKQVGDHFQTALDKKIVKALEKSRKSGEEILGLEGIFRNNGTQMDFALNVSPLRGKRGKFEGLTLLFTDQSRERELKSRMDVVVEERRVIKDMFARYLSSEVVESLMEYPELVKPGGAKKTATIFFADIRGYTSFSETKDPEYIIGVLNEYFSQAVEIIVRHKGFIDKFIGDAIMAAWGVPMMSEEEDAIQAVSCALEIQELIRSEDRTFFVGDASNLKVGIGMHTGPLVAGNLGSAQRMDYSVIGDTVNVAARLEGVAGPGEVVITENTRDLVGDRFKLKEREPVSVKGKAKPIHIFNVLKRVR